MLENAGLSSINLPASSAPVRKLKLSELAGSLRSGWEDHSQLCCREGQVQGRLFRS